MLDIIHCLKYTDKRHTAFQELIPCRLQVSGCHDTDRSVLMTTVLSNSGPFKYWVSSQRKSSCLRTVQKVPNSIPKQNTEVEQTLGTSCSIVHSGSCFCCRLSDAVVIRFQNIVYSVSFNVWSCSCNRYAINCTGKVGYPCYSSPSRPFVVFLSLFS